MHLECNARLVQKVGIGTARNTAQSWSMAPKALVAGPTDGRAEKFILHGRCELPESEACGKHRVAEMGGNPDNREGKNKPQSFVKHI